MESIIGAVLEQGRLVSVGARIIIVSQFVVDGNKVLIAYLNTHLQANVLLVINIPGAGVAHHIAVPWLDEQRTVPEGLRRRIKAQRTEKVYAVADHA